MGEKPADRLKRADEEVTRLQREIANRQTVQSVRFGLSDDGKRYCGSCHWWGDADARKPNDTAECEFNAPVIGPDGRGVRPLMSMMDRCAQHEYAIPDLANSWASVFAEEVRELREQLQEEKDELDQAREAHAKHHEAPK